MPITLRWRQMRRPNMGALRHPRRSGILPGRDVRLSQSGLTAVPNRSGIQFTMPLTMSLE